MRSRALLLLVAMTTGGVACGNDSFSSGDGDSGEVDPGDGGGDAASADGAPPSSAAPASVTFVDQDPTASKVSGDVKVARVADESNVTAYALYWSQDGATKLGAAITHLAKTGGDLTYSFPAATTAPPNANFLLAFASNDQGEFTGFATTEGDNYPHLDDMTGTTVEQQTAFGSGIFLQATAKKLGTMSLKSTLLCDAPYGKCVQTPTSLADASAFTSGAIFDSAFDVAGQKILSIANDSASAPHLIICKADGTSCSDPALNASFPSGSASMIIDDTGGRLYLFGGSGAGTGQIDVCSHDGTGCTLHALSANIGPTGAYAHTRMAIESTSHSLLIVADDKTNGQDQLSLLRCPLTFGGSDACSSVSISAAANSGLTPSIAIDAKSGKLLIVSEYFTPPPGTTTSLFRCNLDGTGCAARVDLSTEVGFAAGLEEYPSAVFDPDGAHLYIGVSNSNTNSATLYRCNSDGTGCTTTTLATGGAPTLHYDSATRRVYFAYQGTSSLVLGSIATW